MTHFTQQNSEDILLENKLFADTPANRALKICVILPVRNEEDNLTRALDALRLQQDGFSNPFPEKCYEVLLLANNCTDQSVEIARAYQRKYPTFRLLVEDIILPAGVAHIGTVRRLLMDAAYNRFSSLSKDDGVIASTDSDSEVGRQWLHYTMQEIGYGSDVVGGRILTKPEKSISRLYYLRDITYKTLVSRVQDLLDPVKYDPWPRHFQCFGASFAVTCSMYDRSGRMPVVPFLEDMAFHKSLIRIDAKIRLSPLVQVATSSRTQGRVDFGLSVQLKQWGEMNEKSNPIMVEPAGSLVLKLTARKLLRDAWDAKENSISSEKTSEAAYLLCLDNDWLSSEMRKSHYFGSFWEMTEERIIQQGWASVWPAMDVTAVIPQLRSEISRITVGSQFMA